MFGLFNKRYTLTEDEAHTISDMIEDLINSGKLDYEVVDRLTMIQAKLPEPTPPNNILEFRPHIYEDSHDPDDAE